MATINGGYNAFRFFSRPLLQRSRWLCLHHRIATSAPFTLLNKLIRTGLKAAESCENALQQIIGVLTYMKIRL
jgi:hypothetical protein